MEEKKCYEVVVSGIVQGVGYRFYTKLMADRLDIGGNVKNLKNGDVQLTIAMSDSEKEKFVRQLWRGTQFSKVTKVDVREMGYYNSEDFSEFEVKFK